MDNLPINILDAVIIGAVLLSAIVGLFRGFIREVLSLAAWIGAGWITLTYFPEAREFAAQSIDNELFAGIVAGACLFIGSLIILMIIARLIAKGVEKTKMLGPLDRMLGFLFGALRGVAIVCLAYLFITQLLTEAETPPDWVAQAQLLPYVEEGAAILEQLIPEDIQSGYTRDVNESMDLLIQQRLQDSEAGTE